jgi:SAM-dependent methyltransferase
MSSTETYLKPGVFRSISRVVPEILKAPLRRQYATWSFARPESKAPYYCTVCKRGLTRFRALESTEMVCPLCFSRPRHRMVWPFFSRRTNLFDGQPKKMLHVGPEIQFEKALSRAVGTGYITADLAYPKVTVRMDLTQIPFPPDFFDVVFCSHVLEHVPDDRKAMQELARVLKLAGWAVIMVPCFPDRGPTFEDFTVTDPAERLKLFGQEDHVRIYGNDFVDRLAESGFEVAVVHPSDFLSPEEIIRFAISSFSGDVFLCTKRGGSAGRLTAVPKADLFSSPAAQRVAHPVRLA